MIDINTYVAQEPTDGLLTYLNVIALEEECLKYAQERIVVLRQAEVAIINELHRRGISVTGADLTLV